MAGSLVKIAENTVSSATSSVTLTGIDSTYDVYLVVTSNVTSTTDNGSIRMRVTTSGTADTSSNYDNSYRLMSTSFSDQSNVNMSSWEFAGGVGTGTGEKAQNVCYLFQFNNSSDFSFITWNNANFNHGAQLYAAQGGQVHTVQQACDGVNFFGETGNIEAGSKFVLYGFNK